MSRKSLFLPFLGVIAVLAGCGGHDNGSSSNVMANASPMRGQLIATPTLAGTFTTSDLLSQLTSDPLGKELLTLALSPSCTVSVWHMEYRTVGGQGEATTASGALMVPSGSAGSCTGARPIVMYAHGTNASKTFNMADLSHSSEALIMAAVFAASGYIVIAPNYVGYDTSTSAYHPYLNADQQSKDMIDALAAGRSALATAQATASGKLFVTGYSQGGFVAMATHRALQAAGAAVTASAPMSGPYALAALADAIFLGQVNGSGPLNFDLLVTSYQHSYGNLYSMPTDIYEPQYANTADELLPSTDSTSTIYSEGKLPRTALFSSTPPSAAYASITPATQPANLAVVFAQGFGTNNLVTNAYRLAYLEDEAAHPDGGFPNTTTGVPAAAPANAFREDLKTNDLRNWGPTAPVLLCAGDGDPTVFYFDTQLMQGYWAMNPPSGRVSILDVDSSPGSGDPYGTLKTAFAAAKATVAALAVANGATDGGAVAVLEAYHATLVPPFCVYAVKSFFDGY